MSWLIFQSIVTNFIVKKQNIFHEFMNLARVILLIKFIFTNSIEEERCMSASVPAL